MCAKALGALSKTHLGIPQAHHMKAELVYTVVFLNNFAYFKCCMQKEGYSKAFPLSPDKYQLSIERGDMDI